MGEQSEVGRRAKLLLRRLGVPQQDSDGFDFKAVFVGPYEVIGYPERPLGSGFESISIVRHDLLKMIYREEKSGHVQAEEDFVTDCLAEMRKHMVLDDLASVGDPPSSSPEGLANV